MNSSNRISDQFNNISDNNKHGHYWAYWFDLDCDRSSRAGRYRCLKCGLKLITFNVDDCIEKKIAEQRNTK